MTAVLKSKQDKVLKELRALPANKRCFDCSVGVPTYVNTTVNTFVCQSCAGVLRELQHRVKGISMASFTKEELAALAAGGNELAGRVWRRNNLPEAQAPGGAGAPSMKRHMEFTYVAKKWYNPQAANSPAPAPATAPPKRAVAAQADDAESSGDEPESLSDDDAPIAAAQKTTPAAAAPRKQVDLLGDLLSFDDVKTVSHDPFATPSPAAAAPAAGLGGFDFGGSPFGAPQASAVNPFASPAPPVVNPFAAAPAPAPAAAVNPFAAAPAPVAVNPFAPVAAPAPAATANPFLAQLGINPFASAPVAAPAPAPAPAPKAQPFNPFLDAAPQSSSDALLAQKLQQEEIAAAKAARLKQEDADRQLAMKLAQSNDFF
jgi:hypothetical protein